MVKTVTPFSTRAREGATDSPLGDYVDVDQAIISTASAGFYDENGKLTGNTSSDRYMIGFTQHLAIANDAAVLAPATGTSNHIDMTGFKRIQWALNVSVAGNYNIDAVYGPDTVSYGGLTPVGSNDIIQIVDANGTGLEYAIDINNHAITSPDTWYIYSVEANRLADQKNLQFRITNKSGSIANILFAYMRLV